MVSFIKKNLNSDFDFAVWTGDNTSHDVWHQTMEKNIENTRLITEAFKKAFPDKIFFPQMGNHESYPVNVYDYSGTREHAMQKEFSDMWKDWIGEDGSSTYT